MASLHPSEGFVGIPSCVGMVHWHPFMRLAGELASSHAPTGCVGVPARRDLVARYVSWRRSCVARALALLPSLDSLLHARSQLRCAAGAALAPRT